MENTITANNSLPENRSTAVLQSDGVLTNLLHATEPILHIISIFLFRFLFLIV